MEDLISVIIPVYNVEKLLVRCLDSVINQTYRKLDIIIINDGSTDGSAEICDFYKSKDERVRVVHKINGGLSSARNKGIDISEGNYISFLDSDDWIDVNYVQKLMYLMKKHNANISICNYDYVYNNDHIIMNKDVEIKTFNNIDALNALSGEYYLQMVTAWGAIYHRDIFEELRYPVGKIHEDEFLAHHVLYKSKKVVLTSEKLLYYWQRDDSIMGHGLSVKNKLDLIEALRDRALFMEEINLHSLSDIAYHNVFKSSVQVLSRKNEIEDLEIFNDSLKKLKYNLRKGNQRKLFKIIYELFFMMPRLSTKIMNKKLLKGRHRLKNE